MPSNDQKQQLPIPQQYQQIKLFLSACISELILSTVLLLSFLLDQYTNVHTIHQSMCLSIIGISISLFLELVQIHNYELKKIISHRFVIVALIFCTIIGFKVPYYSLISISSMLGYVFLTVKQWQNLEQMEKNDRGYIIVLTFFLSLCCIKKEAFLPLSWKIVLFFPMICLILLITALSICLIDLCLSRQQEIYRNQAKKEIIIIFNGLLAHLAYFLCLLKVYLPSYWFIKIILITLLTAAPLGFLFYYFQEQIVLLYCCPKFLKMETLFRVHYRHYANQYSSMPCTQNIQWAAEQCLLCNEKASVVNLNCGHLTVCIYCQGKIEQKRYPKCLLCEKQFISFKVLLKNQEIKRQGFQRKFFIEKKLYKNQVRTI